jgi:hypothetical protein
VAFGYRRGAVAQQSGTERFITEGGSFLTQPQRDSDSEGLDAG